MNNKKNPDGPLRSRLNSFKYAMQGVAYFLRSEINGRIHFIAALCAIALGLYLQLESSQWLWVSSAIAIVIMAEMVNTAIEILVDIVSPDYSEKAGRIKDVAAASVLVASLYAAFVGIVVFVRPLIHLFE